MESDENLLDTAGQVAIIVGVVVIGFALYQLPTASIPVIVDLVEAGSQLIIFGILAIVGGAAVMAYVRKQAS